MSLTHAAASELCISSMNTAWFHQGGALMIPSRRTNVVDVYLFTLLREGHAVAWLLDYFCDAHFYSTPNRVCSSSLLMMEYVSQTMSARDQRRCGVHSSQRWDLGGAGSTLGTHATIREELKLTYAKLNAAALAGDSHTGCRVRLGNLECGG